MAILFKGTKALENQIDEFLDAISDGMNVFKIGLKNYLENDMDKFLERIGQVDKYESKADSLRRDIETHLYSHSLIPEHRGDVLGLLESMDNIIDCAKNTLDQFDVEMPDIPEKYNESFLTLADYSINAAESIVVSVRAFFKEINAVKNHLHKVYFFEKEADKLGDQIKREIFRSDLRLSHKIHLRYFTLHVEQISDRAEEVADRLSIYTIKRKI